MVEDGSRASSRVVASLPKLVAGGREVTRPRALRPTGAWAELLRFLVELLQIAVDITVSPWRALAPTFFSNIARPIFR